MEKSESHQETPAENTPVLDVFVGIRDLLPTGGNIPLDLTVLLPGGKLAVVGSLGKNSTRDLVLSSKSSTLSLQKGSRFFVRPPRRTSQRPDITVGGLATLDIRRPLPRRRGIHVLDVRHRRYCLSRKYVDLVPPVYTVWSITKKRSRLMIHTLGRVAPRASILMSGTAVGIVVLALALLIIKTTVESDVARGYARLAALSRGEGGSFDQAVTDIRFSFRRATLLFAPVSWIANNPVYRNSRVVLADHAIDGGRALSDALIELNLSASRVLRDVRAAGEWKNIAWTTLLSREKPSFEKVVADLESANALYEKIIPQDIPDPAAARLFVQARESLAKASTWGRFALDNWSLVMNALGESYPVKILVLNQNRDELRAGGGFPGSVGVVDMYQGRIANFELKDIYWFDWRLFPYKEPAPEGINRLYNNDGTPVSFGLRDANYFPSFLESARKIDFFFQKAGQGSLDGIIGVNQGMIIDLLRLTGPVYLSEIGRSIGADDFSLAMSLLVEARMYAKASPKDILFRFGEEFGKRLVEKGDWGAYLKVVAHHFSDGDIPVAWLRPEIQTGLVDVIRPVDQWKYDTGDFAYPLFTSYSGNKSDRLLRRTLTLTSNTADHCQRSLVVDARHTFSAVDEVSVRKWMFDLGILKAGKNVERLVQIQGMGDNNQYMRLVLPLGARLISSQGATVRQLPNHPKYSLLDWYQTTKAGTVSRVEITYQVPKALCEKTPTLYRQPGLVADMVVR